MSDAGSIQIDLRNRWRSRSKLRQTSRDTVRLMLALVDQSGLKIINSRVIDLANINTVVDVMMKERPDRV